MPYPELTTERMQLLAVIHPDLNQGRYYTPWINMNITHKLLARVIVGDIGQGATVDFELQEATDANGTGAKAITAKAITQLTQAGGDSNDTCAINLRTEEMDAANDFDYVRGRLDVNTASANVCVIIDGDVPRYAPVSTAAYTEVIA